MIFARAIMDGPGVSSHPRETINGGFSINKNVTLLEDTLLHVDQARHRNKTLPPSSWWLEGATL